MITAQIPSLSDPLAVDRFTCREGISRLFEMTVDVSVSRTSTSPLAFDAVLGKGVSVTLALADGSVRYFHGICKSVAQGAGNQQEQGPFAAIPFRLELVPELWLLGRRAQSRIFQHLSVPDILHKVLTGLTTRFALTGHYEPRDYCTQYRETDFDFAARLMEEEGIFYFFEHANGKHTLVVGDSPGVHTPLATGSTIRFDPTAGKGLRRDEDRIHTWEKRQTLTSSKVTLWDHAFELPHKHLEAEEKIIDSVAVGAVTHKLRLGANDKLELYDHPGEYAKRFSGTAAGGGDQPSDIQKIFQDNVRTAKIRAGQVDAGAVVITGEGTCRQMVSGFKFTLARNADADGDYLLTTVEHEVRPPDGEAGETGEEVYTSRFTCIPAALPFRPPRTTPRPFVHGCQTAVVVGPNGEEIFTDKYGRVKVQFHWDREGKNDASSSCWLRVASFWAGQQWGAVHLPRIGQEVVVDFLEGDPDRPLVTGSVYNADQMPPYALPANKTQSGIKSRSTPKGSAANCNEIRFEDKKGSEQVLVHAEKDFSLEVEHDETHWVGHDRTRTVDNDETVQVKGNRTATVDKDETLTVHKNQTLTVDKDQTITVSGKRTESVDKDETITISGARTESVSKDESVSIGGARAVSVGKDDTLDVSKTFKLTAADEITLETGQSKLTMKKDGTITIEGLQINVKGNAKISQKAPQVEIKADGNVDIKGAMVKINGDGMLQIKAPMSQVNGDGMLMAKGGITMIN